MKSKRIIITALFFLLHIQTTFAADSTWTRNVDFSGTARHSAVGFSIGSKGYLGTGLGSEYSRDFWEYDSAADTWTQKANFEGAARSSAIGFSIGAKGYIGTGWDGSALKRDFWEFDPAANTWTRKADFGGTARYAAVGFSVGSKGYIGTGHSGLSSTNDFWEYDPDSDLWTQKVDFAGSARYSAIGFSIGNKGYIGTGFDSKPAVDFWEYDPAANTWTRKADFKGISRYYAVGMSVDGKGYVGTGWDGSSLKQDFWEYDPAADVWTRKADFGGTARYRAVGFAVGSRGYIGTGWSGTSMNEVWSYGIPERFISLYFPFIASISPWRTELGIINSDNDALSGTLKAFNDEGHLLETKTLRLPPKGRKTILVDEAFTSHADMGYILLESNSKAVLGYTSIFKAGFCRASVPATKNANTSDIHLPHIALNAQWRTSLSLLNTTSSAKVATIFFNNGASRQIILHAHGHKTLDIAQDFFNNQPPMDIQSALIQNANGIIGVQLFSARDDAHMEGMIITDKMTSTLYYPHIVDDSWWWTGIVAYNPLNSVCKITVTPFNGIGNALDMLTLTLAGKGKYVGTFDQLVPSERPAWIRIDSETPLAGFELIGSSNGQQLAAHAGMSGISSKTGVFPKIERNGWTGIVLVNTEDGPAHINLTARGDDGHWVATQVITVHPHGKIVDVVEKLFYNDISDATYIAYTSDRDIVVLQIDGSSDGTMLDGLPGI